MARFDEIELQPAIFEFAQPAAPAPPRRTFVPASPFRRLAALLTDLSLFAALALALSPLLPPATGRVAVAALGAFVVLVSFYYFAGCWLLWGKTIGGTIFDVKVVPVAASAMSFQRAAKRWAGLFLSLLTCGLGFALAALPSRRSLPDRISDTRSVSAQP